MNNLTNVKIGLALVMFGLLFGIGFGITFGTSESFFKTYIARGMAAHPELHDAKSPDRISRYARRAHFHATGIAAFSIGLLLLVSASDLKKRFKAVTVVFIGLGSLYSFAWLVMFILSASVGRNAIHSYPLAVMPSYIGICGLLLGAVILLANLFFGLFSERNATGQCNFSRVQTETRYRCKREG